jgi:dienelactone hydrolase
VQRNLSLSAYFNETCSRHTPRYRFSGSTQADWKAWRRALLPAVKATLGRMPQKVDLKAEIQAEWTEDDIVKQKVIFDVEDAMSAVAYVFRPAESSGELPAILACHGHGPFGKEPVMGNRSSPELRANLEQHNYDYGLAMAKAGYAVIAIDWRGFGQRDDRGKPYRQAGYDPCNMNYLRATLLGETILGMNVHDGMCALDYLCGLEFVDAGRIGAMGLSYGGTMTTWLSICDERIKAADIICYSDVFADFAMRDLQFCGAQITPGLYELCDLPDLHGLIAPRPLLVEIGIHDTCFLVDSAMKCYREVEKIYAAAGAADKLELDLFEGGHRWGANKSLDFFAKHLGG